MPVLQVSDLSLTYQIRQGEVKAVQGVGFELARGQSLGLVGESGCGKSSVANCLMGLLPDNARVTGGRVLLGGEDILSLSEEDLRKYRWRRIAMVFQDPYESMNPRRTIYDIVSEPLAVQKIGSVMDRVERVSETLTSVGLTPAADFLFRHPHELSGGQRQRVAIARALVIRPRFVVADEPTSMLDVSSRTGIMLLMQQLARDLGIAYLYVTHDLAVARYMCDRIAVMYLGKVVELAETEELLRNPLHPYTKALLSAVPVPDPGHRREPPNIRGDLTLTVNPPDRCRFL
ncbi:Oligopeptide transport ATP-binding protein AppF [Geodia barretti]|uniref:Oligopeptide transport ATP-binding protein AppF n=1 Tax=Geodia barretti TaxID=519541 RepID=A0AA35TFG1_GEOBA|nr:Oligopeptide transport ATP-binding protein AppF [Geodia barretti]